MNERKPPGRHSRQAVELDDAAKARIEVKPEQPVTNHRNRVRAWILIVLGVLMFLAGVMLAIHKFRVVDLAPVGVGIATVLVGIRYLGRREIF
jgi:uncharacterized membrane protein HdeD (DUF308 family)